MFEINNSQSTSKENMDKTPRYEVHMYQYIDNEGNVDEEHAVHFEHDDLRFVLQRASSYYRHTKNPLVNIFDNKIADYIAEWD